MWERRHRIASLLVVAPCVLMLLLRGAGLAGLTPLLLLGPVWFPEFLDEVTFGTGGGDGPLISRRSGPQAIRAVGWLLILLVAGALAVGAVRAMLGPPAAERPPAGLEGSPPPGRL